ncbi:hypothetical protein OQE50_24160 (plasmid) [Enterobacter kobei]|uniref:hypothetical protein n=1 Tax=Enterobacter kobei TaxID=208224 RepID=UPI00224A9C32|nr:hypothetical protein [Enterobacter kobei]UZQ70272.1 hypothetical protein OQE50_24160 [Enterobacter kobei]
MSLSNRVRRLQQQAKQPEGAAVVMIISDVMDVWAVMLRHAHTPRRSAGSSITG